MNENTLRALLSADASEEAISRALLDMTLQAAPPAVADTARVCALPAWFDADLLARLSGTDAGQAAALLEQVAAFSFVQPREGGGYVYHEATRARLLDWWREPEHSARFGELARRMALPYLALVQEQSSRLKGPDYLDALVVMDAAYPNVRAAWEGVVAAGHWKMVRGFAYAMHDYFNRRGLWAEWVAWTQAGLNACKRAGDVKSCANMQNNLGNAYLRLPTGDRAANMKQAIACYHQALHVFTSEATPQNYAMIQNNLGNVYSRLPTGDRAANLEQAIACYRQALRFRALEVTPLAYAMTQNNLGSAYLHLPTGDRAANLEQAIAYFRQALRVHTPEATPLAYAMTQNNLGSAYLHLPTGDRAANLAQAIECYREALRIYTPEATPLDYAMTQNNLGFTYVNLPTGDRAANLKQAHEYMQRALQTTGLSPWKRAICLFTRGLIYLAQGHMDQACTDYEAALSLADSVIAAEALRCLEAFAAEHPDTAGVDAIRALFHVARDGEA